MKKQLLLYTYLFLPCILSLIFIETGKSQEQVPRREISAARIFQGDIKIDGILNEDAWGKIPIQNEFVQNQPNPGEAATVNTTVRIGYDNFALYVGIYAYEDDPSQIAYQLSRRDVQMPADWIAIMVDSYGDKRTGFTFATYVSGCKYDAYMSDDTEFDENWDAVWEVKTSIQEDGWCAEFRVPFSQLRFPDKEIQSWGFEVLRYRSINNEFDQWQYIPEDAPGWVSQFGRLEGISGIPAPKRLQVLPYLVAKSDFIPKDADDPFLDGKPDFSPRIGADIKYGITSNMTLDLTFNPDFGQVEADPSEVNLTAYETFFEEKRPFFLEGNSIFNYRFGIGDGPYGAETLFYSRRIGRRPQHEPDLPDDYYFNMPQHTNIIGAAKISGKTSGGWSIGILEALTDEMKADIQFGNNKHQEVVEPRTNYLLFRAQKDFREGRTTLGMMFTNVTRDIAAPEIYHLNKSALTSGVDFMHRWWDDNYTVNAMLVGSHIRGRKEAMIEAQESSARYFQRSDANYIDFDPDRTSLSGWGSKFHIGKVAGGHWRGGIGNVIRSPGFETNDMGYLRQADVAMSFLYWSYEEFKPGRFFRRFNLNNDIFEGRNFGGERLFYGVNMNFNFQFLNYWGGFIGGFKLMDQLDPSLLRGGPSFKMPDYQERWLGFFSDERKKISLNTRFFHTAGDNGLSRFTINPTVTIRPISQLDLTFMFNYSIEDNDRQYIDQEETTTGPQTNTHYILSRIKSKNANLTARINYTFTPDLTLQFYGMPFIFAGDYSNFREVISPRASRYNDRFAPYSWGNEDFNFKEFSSNLVMRWEYQPGSTFFVVWAHHRSQETEEDGSFQLKQDVRRLFNAEADNIILLKVNKWFDL